MAFTFTPLQIAALRVQLDQLRAIYVSGALEGHVGDKIAKFADGDQLLKRMSVTEGWINGTSKEKRFSLAGFTKDSSQPTRSTFPDPFGTNNS